MIHTLTFSLSELLPYINWDYFYHAWMLPSGTHRSCRDVDADGIKRSLHDEALSLLEAWQVKGCCARFRVALVEANSDGDDIVLLHEGVRLPMLRQQVDVAEKHCLCLSDFIRPLGQGQADLIGLFASTADTCIESGCGVCEPHLMEQILSDRLAEAAAELGHQHVRRYLWGYAPDEALTPEQMFREEFQGCRPAVGYPSLPDQSLVFLLDEVLHMDTLGIRLTTSGAMIPHASTCGLMLAHPASRHFSVGPIGQDQLVDYASRRGLSVEEMRCFLAGVVNKM